MHTHGKGPRDVLVKGYGRWQRGRFRRVRDSLRGIRPKLSIRPSRHQLKLGFDPPGVAR
jgi:hypothetical protein